MNARAAPGWGNLPQSPPRALLRQDWRFEPLPAAGEAAPMLAVGMRRSYGDACVNEGGTLLDTRRLDRLLAFDAASGQLDCEAGVTLGEILRVVVPRGWYLPVVPGTQHVSLGGAIANDVHGKNHVRAGSFGCHVRGLGLLRSDRGRVECSETADTELFFATIGGLGLTGLITHARLQLRPVPGARMEVEELRFGSLGEYLDLLAASTDREYSVAWVDGSRLAGGCSGRLARGDHAPGAESRRARAVGVPVTPPLSLVGNASGWCFSRLYGALGSGDGSRRNVDHAAWFFPLDGIGHWNRLYGPRGFRQYQCVIPQPAARQGIAELLAAVQRSGLVSPLIVLKDFGPVASKGLLSFPREGLTLAMDFAETGERLRALFARLDTIVCAHGGALYPAKDSRMDSAMFRASFPQLARFHAQLDPAFSSSLWRRVQ